jgi:hypothetical protein
MARWRKRMNGKGKQKIKNKKNTKARDPISKQKHPCKAQMAYYQTSRLSPSLSFPRCRAKKFF